MEKIKFQCVIEDAEFEMRFKESLLSSGYFTMDSNVENGDNNQLLFTDSYTEDMYGTKTVILSNDIGNKTNNEDTLTVYKYTKFKKLVQLVVTHFGYATSLEGKNSLSKAPVITTISSRGGIGCTAIALNLTRALYRNGYKPLFLDFTPFNIGRLGSVEGERNIGMMKFLYEAKRSRLKDISMYVERREGIDTISTDPINMFCSNYDSEMVRVLSASAYISGFDIVLIDVGNHLGDKNLEIVRESNLIVSILSARDDWTDKKVLRIDKSLGLDEGRIIHVLNEPRKLKGDKAEKVISSEDMEKIDVNIPYYGDFTGGDEGLPFADEIRFLADIVGGRLAEG